MSKKGFVKAKLVSWKELKRRSGIFLLEIVCEMPKEVKPGQFIVLKPASSLSVMPRPFSVVNVFPKVSGKKDKIQLVVKAVGKNTEFYTGLKQECNSIELSGPLGRPFSDYSAKKYILVAGGHGFAGIAFTAFKLHQISETEERKKITVLLGAKHRNEIITDPFKEIAEVKTIVENGDGGYVTDLLCKELRYDFRESIVVACGPKPMLEAVKEMAKTFGNKCYVSMEEVMACGGSGACYSCVVPMKKGQPKKLCKDGPIFNAEDVDFSKIKNIKPSAGLKKKSRKTSRPLAVVLEGKGKKKLRLSSPVMYASGCVDVSTILSGSANYKRAGAIVAKGVELNPRPGNPTPRVCETPAGMINAIGLQGVGIDKFISRVLPKLLLTRKPIIANISGGSVDEYVEVASKLSKTEISAIEVNISCPNIKAGGMLFGQNGIDAYEITRVVCEAAPDKFIIVKLTPNVTNIAEIAKCVEEAGADAVSLVNTFLAMDIDPFTRRPKIGNVMGGLSGPAIMPVALRMVYQVVKAVKITVIGMGGIESWEDAAKFIIAGASAVAVGTGNFSNPNAISEICDGLTKWMKSQGANRISDLRDSLEID